MSITDDNDSTRSPTFQEVIERAAYAIVAEMLRTGIPASVQRYDDAKQQVDVKLLVKDFHRDETGALVVAPMPVVTCLPVHFFSAGGFQITSPIDVGDIGWVKFAERSLDRWLSGSGAEVDPEIYTRFNLTDAWFEPGGRPFGAPLASAPTDKMVVGQATKGRIELHKDGSVAIVGTGLAPVNVTIDTGAGGSVVLQGGVLNVARATDTAGPYPIVGGNPFVKA